ncbi:SDR family oxidoreductase [Flavobacterium litorale]|uniref:SDR family oxidoreductase n=1 Tax=Flavobacterium litorale TaxID=2856519 RepID=A0ABX8V8J9_9FLAO|nr:SDR family oxidoreductase [Flavobacterium litorale]QYJ69157.1 SDR family oxidoreductase [Flavobacterium litorale]
MADIALLGCGWLGLPLAKQLIAAGYSIKGTTTTPSKIPVLHEAGIQPYCITLHEDETTGNVTDFLEGCDTLIIDIPPGLRKDSSASFVAKINTFFGFVNASCIKKVLFISSTSVYGATAGTLTESAPPNPKTESGKQLLEVENILQENTNYKATIVRFGGLIGNDRHPARYLAGKSNLPSPNAPVNLIQREDCIGIMQKIITDGALGYVFNAVADYHPTRKEYYTKKAKEMKLSTPMFNEADTSGGKIIASENLQEVLNYNFIHPKP